MDFKADSTCKHCNGGGTIGRDAKTKQPVLCRCIVKQIQKSARGTVRIDPLKLGHQVGMRALYGEASVRMEKMKDPAEGVE